MNHSIQRGVSLYSYQVEVFLGQMTLDDCIAHVQIGDTVERR